MLIMYTLHGVTTVMACCYSCGGVHLCAAASAPILVFRQGLKAMSLKVTSTGDAEQLSNINEADIIFGAQAADYM
jgi:hypothetical protein